MRKTTLVPLGAIALIGCLAGCGGGDRNGAGADSLSRDLSMVPGDSTHALGDRDAAGGTAARSDADKQDAFGRSLAAGTSITTTTTSRISSATDKAGETVNARVAADVKDAAGLVVIPAGSMVRLRITAIHESENKSDATGTLALATESVEIGDHTYPLKGTVRVNRALVGRKTNVNDVAKVGVGAGAGAVAGRVLGGSKGTVIGGVLGGAVGAQRAVETKDRDVVVASGSTARIVLTSGFER
jgi:hypothetical protein